jgi:hypothetical protein
VQSSIDQTDQKTTSTHSTQALKLPFINSGASLVVTGRSYADIEAVLGQASLINGFMAAIA